MLTRPEHHGPLARLTPRRAFPRFETSGLFRYIGDTSAISESLQGFPAGSPVMTGLVATKNTFWRISRHEFETLNDRVLVKRLESEERTASGLYIPDTAKEKPSKGEVVAVGPGKHADDGKLVPMAVKVGDMVLFNKYAGTEVKIDGAEHLVMREDDILAIIA